MGKNLMRSLSNKVALKQYESVPGTSLYIAPSSLDMMMGNAVVLPPKKVITLTGIIG